MQQPSGTRTSENAQASTLPAWFYFPRQSGRFEKPLQAWGSVFSAKACNL
ncbi:hypothetical protein SB48_HM08orf04874 [Heyndrickxia coagulans]|uniref:Uncharacterized protein n=1 Tax=Heyndrickxia coagulans TaxID=1398 RepID=A0AAN0T6Q0_HEYCO|nr:hypothetical protein SB48_HM08orf04874 [Heyndrickxia coagulans]